MHARSGRDLDIVPGLVGVLILLLVHGCNLSMMYLSVVSVVWDFVARDPNHMNSWPHSGDDEGPPPGSPCAHW